MIERQGKPGPWGRLANIRLPNGPQIRVCRRATGTARGRAVKAFFVTRRLAFGSAITSWSHVERLQTLGITHVINLRFSTHSKKVRQFKALWLPFHDDAKPRPKWFYRKTRKFYRKAMKKPGSRVFVMCHHGLCRSPSMLYFLLRVSDLTEHCRL